jgi:hypothetical protein
MAVRMLKLNRKIESKRVKDTKIKHKLWSCFSQQMERYNITIVIYQTDETKIVTEGQGKSKPIVCWTTTDNS